MIVTVSRLLSRFFTNFILDTYVESPLIMRCAVPGDELDPAFEVSYRQAMDKHWPDTPPIQQIDRSEFYGRAKPAFGILMTGETATSGNIILKKGVTPTIKR